MIALDLEFRAVGAVTVMSRRRHRWPFHVGRLFPGDTSSSPPTVILQNVAGTVIPGDRVTCRYRVHAGSGVRIRGQGAVSITGAPGARACGEHNAIRVDDGATVVVDTGLRIVGPHAVYRPRTLLVVTPGANAILVEGTMIHPDCNELGFGLIDSVTTVRDARDRQRRAIDGQLITAAPAPETRLRAYGTVFVVGDERCRGQLHQELLRCERDTSAYCAVSRLPYGLGLAVRVAAPDGGVLATTLHSVRHIAEHAITSWDTPTAGPLTDHPTPGTTLPDLEPQPICWSA